MTVSTATARVSYVGNGVTTVFPVPFPFIQEDYLIVLRVNATTLDSTTLTLNSGGANGYTVQGAGDASGSVTVVTAPTASELLTVVRSVPATQEADFVSNDPFPAETFEDGLDKLTMIVGQAVSDVNRALKLFEGDIDGSGRYDANANRIVDLADGVNPSDAATVGQLIGAGSGNFIQPYTGSVTRTMQDKVRETVSITDFGGNGNDAADNAAIFALAEAAGVERIYLPDGTYYTTGAASSLGKHYYGPGKIRTSGGDNTPGRFTWQTVRPDSGTGTGYERFFSADLSAVDASYQISASNRTTLTEEYFAPETSHILSVFDNRSGYSGTTSRLTVIAALGATSATLNSADGLSIGDTIGFNDGTDGITNIRVLTNVAGNVISWTDPLIAPAPYAVGYRITLGKRTMQSMAHLELQHRGGGDGYIHLMRVEASYTGTAGQDNTYFRSTAGMDGGDMVASTDGVYMTGREITFDGVTYDIAVAADVRTFLRNDATGALEATWIGNIHNSSGTQPADVSHAVAGKWNCVIDASRADLTSNGGCVLGMAVDQYLYWGNTATPGLLYTSWSDILGPYKFGYSNSRAAFAFDGAPISGDTLHVAPATVASAAIGYVASGVYTPTLTNGVNVAASTAYECHWTRVGKVVTVSGQVGIDPTAGATLTELGVSLPIASAFSAGRQLGGVAASEGAASLSARVTADIANDRASIAYTNTADVAARDWSFTFQYLVV